MAEPRFRVEVFNQTCVSRQGTETSVVEAFLPCLLPVPIEVMGVLHGRFSFSQRLQ